MVMPWRVDEERLSSCLRWDLTSCCSCTQGEGTLYNLTGVGYATDLYGATARTTFAPVNVLPARFTVTELAGNVTSLLADAVKTSDIDSIFQVSALLQQIHDPAPSSPILWN
jgi:hypothetical protein